MIHDFKKSLETGNPAELFVKKYYRKIFEKYLSKLATIEIADYQRKAHEIQRKGIDGFIRVTIPYEVKVRDHSFYQYEDILLEIMAVNEKNKLGWLYTTESKIVVYLWFNEKQEKFIDGYLLDIKRIRNWLKKTDLTDIRKVKTRSKSGNGFWTTISIVIPITDFPINCIQRIPTKIFRKRIPTIPEWTDYREITEQEVT